MVAKDKGALKREFVQFRCTVYEKKLLKVKARKSGLSLSEFCRRAAFEDQIIERLTQEPETCRKLGDSARAEFQEKYTRRTRARNVLAPLSQDSASPDQGAPDS